MKKGQWMKNLKQMTIRVNDVRIEDLERIITELKGTCERVDVVVDDETRTLHIYPVEFEVVKPVFKITDDNIGDLI
jgi:hypothetical protein